MTDEQLRRALHDAVADVEPRRDLDDVHARSAGGRSWAGLTVVAAALATVLALTGAVWLVQRGGDQTVLAPTGSRYVVAWTVVDTPTGPRLAADRRQVTSTGDAVQDAVVATLTGTPSDPDHRPVVAEPGGLTVTTGPGPGGSTRVDVETRGADLGASELVVTQAVAWAVASNVADGPDAADVTLVIDGSPTGGPYGTQTDVLAPVVVESVGEGETVPGTFTVSGLAAAFEGTVAWRLLDGDAVVQEGFTTAAEGGTASPYSFEVTAPPGTYVLEVGETDPSDGEGFPAYVETRTVTVGR